MTTKTEFTLESGGTVIVECAEPPGVGPAGHVDQALQRAGTTLRASLGSVVEAAAEMMQAFQTMPRRPDEVEVKFGVSLGASFGAVIAGSTGKAQLDVTLRWSPEPAAPRPAEEDPEPDASS